MEKKKLPIAVDITGNIPSREERSEILENAAVVGTSEKPLGKKILVVGSMQDIKNSEALKHIQDGGAVVIDPANNLDEAIDRIDNFNPDSDEVLERHPDDGKLGGKCYRTMCKAVPALYYHIVTKQHYCKDCASMINEATRSIGYQRYGRLLLKLSEDLTTEQVSAYEQAMGKMAGFLEESPTDAYMSGRSMYYDNLLDTRLQDMMELYDDVSKEDRKYADRVVSVEPTKNIGRNDPCHCGSGKKYKQCHYNLDRSRHKGDQRVQGNLYT